MWSRAAGLSDAQLTHFTIEHDLVQVCSGVVSYGTIILGKIKIPAVKDELGSGYVHVRCVWPTIGRSLLPFDGSRINTWASVGPLVLGIIFSFVKDADSTGCVSILARYSFIPQNPRPSEQG